MTIVYANPHGYTAVLDATTDTTNDGNAWVAVYAWDQDSPAFDGHEAMYSLGKQLMDDTTTGITVDDQDRAREAADALLEASGWKRTDPWDSRDDAIYATVERA